MRNIPHPRLNDISITFVEHHKHLDIILEHDAEWLKHIDNISISAGKLVGMMCNVKFLLSMKILNQIYISFLRPILEYASVVWYGCAQYEKDKLEKIQH